ncbi:MAG: SPOR domain-containing protein [bacterium]|nr:SPOR domain-containing protein [bacterium]
MEKQRPNSENSSIFGKIVNYLVIITIFFGLGYWCGKQNYTYQTAIDFLSSKKPGIKKAVKPKSEEEIPDDLTYNKSLKDNDEILLPSEKLKAGKKESPIEDKIIVKPVTLQLASYKKEINAIDHVKKLNMVGLKPYVKKYDLKKQGIWYRVLWGDFESKEAALEYADQNFKPLNIYYMAVEK